MSVDHAASLPRPAAAVRVCASLVLYATCSSTGIRSCCSSLRPDAPLLPDDEAAARSQDRHLAFRADLRDRGYLIGGGPLVDQDDEHLRGISIMTCDAGDGPPVSNEEPAVQAGRLAVEVMTWMVPAGNVHFENVPAPRSMAEARRRTDGQL